MTPNDEFHKKRTLTDISSEEGVLPVEVPKMIGPYKIESLMEKGGMSLLYLGSHPDTEDATTIKVLLPRYLSHPDMVQRFLNEAEIIALTDHPNIVKLYGHGEWEGGLYIAMEYIQGISLRQALQQNPISLKRALEIIIDIAYALCHLHTHGVIHRDLKPENILITDTGEVKVIDFGIAQLLTEKAPGSGVTKQRLIGTPIYMSPEQRENPETVSYPSDIYSLGIIAYELVLGKLSHGQIHLALMPKGLHKILNKALQPNPHDRYHDIVDFITDVSSYLHSSNLQKEKVAGDQLSELMENMRNAQSILSPLILPEWKGVEMGLSIQRSLNNYTYYEFFSSSDAYNVIMGESSSKGAEGALYTAMLRGIVQSAQHLIDKPAELASALNALIIKDKIDKTFPFTHLHLIPKENKCIFLSCFQGTLWHFSEGKINKINPMPTSLGISLETQFQERSLSWNIDDFLLMSSLNSLTIDQQEQIAIFDDFFQKIFLDTAHATPQKMVDAVLRKAKIDLLKLFPDKVPVFIGILRRT